METIVAKQLDQVLQNSDLRRLVTQADCDWLAERLTALEFQAGETVIERGVTDTGLYLIVKGKARLVDGSPEPVVLSIRGPGDNFGEDALLANTPAAATVQ